MVYDHSNPDGTAELRDYNKPLERNLKDIHKNQKEKINIMTKKIRKMRYQNRIDLMNSRTGVPNCKLIKKLQRRLRQLESAAAGDVAE